MRTVLLRLEGPLQSWGTRSRFAHRDTETEPSKSGVMGVIGAALGMRRDDVAQLARLAASSFSVRVDQEGTVLRDYHTVGDGTFRGQPYFLFGGGGKHAVLTERHYLEGASFLAAAGFDDPKLAEEVDAALRNPRWPLYLGRRSCPPSLPIYVPGGALDGSPEEGLRAAPFPRHEAPLDARKQPRRLRLVVECTPNHPDAQPRQDQPLSYRLSDRHYARRFVRTAWIESDQIVLTPKEAPCISLAAF